MLGHTLDISVKAYYPRHTNVNLMFEEIWLVWILDSSNELGVMISYFIDKTYMLVFIL